MPKLKKQGLRILKMIHLFLVVMWIGGAITLLTVLFLSNRKQEMSCL